MDVGQIGMIIGVVLIILFFIWVKIESDKMNRNNEFKKGGK